MKKDIRISLFIIATLVSLFFGLGIANASVVTILGTDGLTYVCSTEKDLQGRPWDGTSARTYGLTTGLCKQVPVTSSTDSFDISGEPTNGLTLNGEYYSIEDLKSNKPKQIKFCGWAFTYYDTKWPKVLFNANSETLAAIEIAWNHDNQDRPEIWENIQALISRYGTWISGPTGYVTYNGSDIKVKNGVLTIDGIVGIINSNGKYRFSDGRRSIPGLTRYKFLPPDGTGEWIKLNTLVPLPPSPPTPFVSTFTASPATITSGQSSTLSWTSNTTACVINANGISRAANGTLVVSPTSTTQYSIICSKSGDYSEPKTVTVTVSGTTSSGSTTNPYGSTLSSAAKNTISTWITKNIKSRSTTLSSSDYSKFVETIISRLNQIKAATPASNVNKLNVINYLVWELQQILSESIFDGLF